MIYGFKQKNFIEVMQGLVQFCTEKNIQLKPGLSACTDGKSTIYLPWLSNNASEEDFKKFYSYASHEQSHFHGNSAPWKMSTNKIIKLLQNAVDDIRCESLQEKTYPGFGLRRHDFYRIMTPLVNPEFTNASKEDTPNFISALGKLLIIKIRIRQLDIKDIVITPSEELAKAYSKYFEDMEEEVERADSFEDACGIGVKLYDRLKDMIREEIEKRTPPPPPPTTTKEDSDDYDKFDDDHDKSEGSKTSEEAIDKDDEDGDAEDTSTGDSKLNESGDSSGGGGSKNGQENEGGESCDEISDNSEDAESLSESDESDYSSEKGDDEDGDADGKIDLKDTEDLPSGKEEDDCSDGCVGEDQPKESHESSDKLEHGEPSGAYNDEEPSKNDSEGDINDDESVSDEGDRELNSSEDGDKNSDNELEDGDPSDTGDRSRDREPSKGSSGEDDTLDYLKDDSKRRDARDEKSSEDDPRKSTSGESDTSEKDGDQESTETSESEIDEQDPTTEYEKEISEWSKKIEHTVERNLDEIKKDIPNDTSIIDTLKNEIEKITSSMPTPYMVHPSVIDHIDYNDEGTEFLAKKLHENGIKMLGSSGSRMTKLFTSLSKPKTCRNKYEGRIDMRSFMSDPIDIRKDIYSIKKGAGIEKAAVSIMMDNSGSMMEIILEAYAMMSGIAHYLSKACIPTEIVGFTSESTRNQEYRDVPVFLKIVKKFEDPWNNKAMRRCVPPNSMIENAEVDCLRWAVPRLWARPEKKKILFIIGDGEPAIGNDSLNSKLSYAYKEYINLCRKAGIVVFGFGINCNLSWIFGEDYIDVTDSNMGEKLVEKLTFLLKRSNKNRLAA